MDRRIALSVHIDTPADVAAEVLDRRAEELFSTASVRLTASLVDDCHWAVTLGGKGRSSSLPNFVGQLALVFDEEEVVVALIGSYRLRTKPKDDDVVTAHLAACDALEAYLDGVASRVDAAAKERAAPMTTGSSDYAEDFRRRHGVNA